MGNGFEYAVYKNGSWSVNLEMLKKHLQVHSNNQGECFCEMIPAFYVLVHRNQSN